MACGLYRVGRQAETRRASPRDTQCNGRECGPVGGSSDTSLEKEGGKSIKGCLLGSCVCIAIEPLGREAECMRREWQSRGVYESARELTRLEARQIIIWV
jgi:hypothetical protein